MTKRHTPQHVTNDFCGPEGAIKLKKMIEDYWIQRGYDPAALGVSAEKRAFTPVMRTSRFDIRSKMVNGRPSL